MWRLGARHVAPRGTESDHERRWDSDTVTGKTFSSCASSSAAEEYVEVTLDFNDDDTIVLCNVEPVGAIDIESDSRSVSRSPTMRRSTLNRFLQFSQESKAEAVAKAKQLTRRFSWGHGKAFSSSQNGINSGFDSALAARALRRQRAELDRTKSGAQKAIRGLRFISNRKGVDGWCQVETNFEKLAKDDFLQRSDFAQCIGMNDSKEFALELFDTLSRRRRLKIDKFSKEELYEFWSQITDESFDSRLQIFFDINVADSARLRHVALGAPRRHISGAGEPDWLLLISQAYQCCLCISY